MLSSAKIGTSSWRYYTNSVACAATEYYLGAGEAPGRWHGRGLGQLGLEPGALVGEAQLEALFARALHPGTGERLGRAWRTDGVTGFDLTFSAPKSVSSLWALGDPDTARELRAAHAAAVSAALGYLDAHASWSRRGVDGTEQVATGGLAAALFEHRTSRCADPQLHTHALVVNKLRCRDGIWRTIDGAELFHHKKSAGMVYQAALRSEIHSRTGLAFDVADNNGQAETVAVPDGLLRLWSKRTARIEPEAKAKIAEYEESLGRSLTSGERAAVVETAVLKTRPTKAHNDAGTLRERWLAEATGAGYDPGAVLDACRQACRQAPGQALETDLTVVAGAVRAAAGARAVFSRADVAGQVAARLPVDGRSADGVLALVEQYTDRALGLPEAVPVGEHPTGRTPRASDARWAGSDVLAAEARVLSLADLGRGGGYGKVAASTLIVSLTDAGLDLSQYEAISRLAGSGDFLSVLTAPAGAGKTTALGAAGAAWQRAGYRVVGLAPSARAAAELAAATGGPADTLAKWLHDHARRGILPPGERARTALDHRTVVVVDEASMANTLDLATLTDAAARRAAKVVLVGDPAQIGVVKGPGGMLAALANAGHGTQLTGVRRFTEDWERETSLALRQGDPAVLARYTAEGRLHACVDAGEAHDAVHAHWSGLRAGGVDALMMARTRLDVDALNARARAAALANGEVRGPIIRLGERDWQAGDLLRARRNDRRLTVGEGHVRNGDRYRVLTADPAGLLVEDLGGRGRVLLPGDYVAAHAEYGWATTIDAAQGATVEVGILLARPGLDREHLYVAMTRGRQANHAYIAPDTATEPDHHHLGPAHAGARGRRTLDEQAFDVLAASLVRTGAQDAAHTARERARTRAADQQRQAAERARTERTVGPTMPAEHASTAALLAQRQAELDQLVSDQRQHRSQLREAGDELARTSRWSRSRRRELEAGIDHHGKFLEGTFPNQTRLGREIDDLTRQVARDTRQRQDDEQCRARRPSADADSAESVLAAARPVSPVAARIASAAQTVRELGERTRREADQARIADHHRRRSVDHTRGRDDGPSIGI